MASVVKPRTNAALSLVAAKGRSSTASGKPTLAYRELFAILSVMCLAAALLLSASSEGVRQAAQRQRPLAHIPRLKHWGRAAHALWQQTAAAAAPAAADEAAGGAAAAAPPGEDQSKPSGAAAADSAYSAGGAAGAAAAAAGSNTGGQAAAPTAAVDAAGRLRYNISACRTAAELFAAHSAAQAEALQMLAAGGANATGAGRPPRAILVRMPENVGLGNRLPGVVTGYALALLTRRLFVLDSNLTRFVQMPAAADWAVVGPHYARRRWCSLQHEKRHDALLHGCAAVCKRQRSSTLLLKYVSFDYDVPWLQLNPAYNGTLQRLFPDGEVFHALTTSLLQQPTPRLAAVLAPHLALAEQCLVGVHMRTAKKGTSAEQFAGISRGIARARPGTVFVASDDPAMLSGVAARLPGRQVFWADSSVDALQSGASLESGNPGSELSAVVDMLLLAKCKSLVITPGSSFGWVAAGLAGVAPVYATQGPHMAPFYNGWFWRSISSEPCCWTMSQRNSRPELADVARQHPLFFHHNQCHP